MCSGGRDRRQNRPRPVDPSRPDRGAAAADRRPFDVRPGTGWRKGEEESAKSLAPSASNRCPGEGNLGESSRYRRESLVPSASEAPLRGRPVGEATRASTTCSILYLTAPLYSY